MKPIKIFLAVMMLNNCGVEAGNPSGGTKTGTGTAAITFVKTVSSKEDNMALNLSSMELRSGSGESEVSQNLTLSRESVELFSLNGDVNDTSTQISKTSDIPEGVYTKLVIRINDQKPLVIKKKDGSESIGEFNSQEYVTFYFEDEYEIKDGETTEITISLDPDQSFKRDDAGRYDFIPKGHIHPPHQGFSYVGAAEGKEGYKVCAYAYAPEPPKEGRDGDRRRPPMPPSNGSMRPPERGPGQHAMRKPIANAVEELVLDQDSNCANAFVTTLVVGGKYRLSPLIPASYRLLFFATDGTLVKDPPYLDFSVKDARLSAP